MPRTNARGAYLQFHPGKQPFIWGPALRRENKVTAIGIVLDHLKKNATELTGRRIKLFMISDMKGFSYLKIKMYNVLHVHVLQAL